MCFLLLRSVVQTGSGALVIKIPKPWAAFHRLQKGDKVEVLVDNGSLLVRIPRNLVRNIMPESSE